MAKPLYNPFLTEDQSTTNKQQSLDSVSSPFSSTEVSQTTGIPQFPWEKTSSNYQSSNSVNPLLTDTGVEAGTGKGTSEPTALGDVKEFNYPSRDEMIYKIREALQDTTSGVKTSNYQGKFQEWEKKHSGAVIYTRRDQDISKYIEWAKDKSDEELFSLQPENLLYVDPIPSENPPEDPGTTTNTDTGTTVNWYDQWLNLAKDTNIDPQSIFDIISQLPAAEGNADLKRELYKQLNDLVTSKGTSGLVPVEDQFASVKRDLTEASQEQWQTTQGELARKGMLDTGKTRSEAYQRDLALNKNLATERVAIETNNSKMASEQYTNAINKMTELQEQAASGELDWYKALVETEKYNSEQKQAWAQMGLTERLTIMGYDVEKYKADLSASVDRERIQLEKDLGFANLDLQTMIAQNGYSIEKTKIELQKWMTEGGWAQQDADRATARWADLLNAEVQNKRTDVDMISAMGKLTRDEWEKQVSLADLDLKKYLGDQNYKLMQDQMGQDWDKFVQEQALKKWMASNQWDTDKYIANLQAQLTREGAEGDFWSTLIGADATIGASIISSSRDFKTDIVPLTATDESEVLKALLNTEVVRFNYKPEFMDNRRHIGVIAEEAPAEITLSDGRHIDLGNAFGTLLAAVKALGRKIEELENAK
jgi:hypothetical protein